MDNMDDISSMISKIISDPSFGEMVGRVRGDESDKSADEMRGDIASKLPDVMAMLGPMLSGTDEHKNDAKTGASSEDMPEEKGTAERDKKEGPEQRDKTGVIQKKYDKAHAEKLLYAIKPYLNRNRCEIIDKCMSVMQITDVVNAFGGLENLLKNSDK